MREILEAKTVVDGKETTDPEVLKAIKSKRSFIDKPFASNRSKLVKEGPGWISVLDRPGLGGGPLNTSALVYQKVRFTLRGNDGSRVVLIAILAMAWKRSSAGLWELDGEPIFQPIEKEIR